MKAIKQITARLTVGCVLTLGLTTNTPAQLQFTGITATQEGAIRLSWQSETNTLYRIQYANELSDESDWETLTDLYPSHGTNTFALDTGDYSRTPFVLHPRKNPARFYRILNEGTNSAPPPQIAITIPTNGFVAFGSVTVAVAASTDQATLATRLYVDGQEMRPAVDSTNYTSNGTNYLTDSYVLNSCEWPNGTHTLFAVAECESDFAGPVNVTPVNMGHAVSSYVPVTFSNLITRFAWSEPFFQPALGQTQIVSAVFAANVDWTLQMLNASSNAVRTVSGSGSLMQFPWDGTGQGGTNLPVGVYTYLLSAQTNGQASSSAESEDPGSGGDPPSLNASRSAGGLESSSDNWYPTSPREALAAGWPYFYVSPPPMPPESIEINGEWISIPWEEVHGPQPLIEVEIPLESQLRYVQSLTRGLVGNSESENSENDPQTEGFGGSSSQATSGPTRPPTAPMLNIFGTFALAYQKYINPSGSGLYGIPNPTMLPPLDGQPYPPNHRVQLMGSSAGVQVTPLKNYGGEALNFEAEMRNGAWMTGFAKRDEELYGSDLKYNTSPFNNSNHIGLLLLHGLYGTSADWYASQCQQIYFPLWSFGVQRDGTVTSREEWVRMSEMNFGSDTLKWMAIKACFSLRQENVVSMDSHFVYPFNSDLHLMLGFDTVCYEDLRFSKTWANLMIKSNLTVYGAWVEAGRNSFKGVPVTIRAAAWGHSGNFGDHITEYLGSSSGDLDYRSDQVHPYP